MYKQDSNKLLQTTRTATITSHKTVTVDDYREGGEAYLRDLPNAEMHRLQGMWTSSG